MKTVGELIEKLEKFDKGLPIQALIMGNGKVDDIISHLIDTEKITSEDFDIDTARVYLYEDTDINELQVFSDKTYDTVYFWCKLGMTREEYLKDRIERMTDEIDRIYSEAKSEMEKLQDDMFCLNELSNTVGLIRTNKIKI